jgi:hypothetical protein
VGFAPEPRLKEIDEKVAFSRLKREGEWEIKHVTIQSA